MTVPFHSVGDGLRRMYFESGYDSPEEFLESLKCPDHFLPRRNCPVWEKP